MCAAGVRPLADSHELSIMGLSELRGGLGRVLAVYRLLRDEFRSAAPPDLVVLIDFPDFNLLVAKAAKKSGIKVFYYVSPQVWAWRRGRIRSICRRVDRMVVLFPFEVELYRARGLDAHFVGHPLAEEVTNSRTCQDTRAKYDLTPKGFVVALLPGSRRREVETLLPPMLEALKLLKNPAEGAIALAPGLEAGLVEELVERSGAHVEVISGDTYNLVAAADVVVTASGTATVECAVLGRPMVVVYRMSRFSYAVARALVRVDFVAMPNIILGRKVVPELIQDDVTPGQVAAEVDRYLADPELRRSTEAELAELKGRIVRPGAALRAASLALETLAS